MFSAQQDSNQHPPPSYPAGVSLGPLKQLWGRVSLVVRASDWHVEKWVRIPACAWHFIILASSVDKDVTGGPVG